MMQLVAALRIASKFWQMQGISVVLQLDWLETASSMQGRAQLGISSRVWACTAAARARTARENFILTVLKGVIIVVEVVSRGGGWNE